MLFMGQTKKKTGWIWEYTIKINDGRFDGLLFLNGSNLDKLRK